MSMNENQKQKLPVDLPYTTLSGTIVPPFSVIYGINIQIHEVIDALIRYYFPKCKSIWDPTVGTENHQFRDYLQKVDNEWYYHGKIYYFPTDKRKTKWTKMLIDLFNTPYPFRDEAFDLIVYDPPFNPYGRGDDRGEDYDVIHIRSPIAIKKFYSEDIIKEFWRIYKQGAIIRGSDFYYPIISDNLYLWLTDIIDVEMIRKYFRIISVHAYRYFHNAVPLLRVRVGQGLTLRHLRRAIITHTYLMVCYKRRQI